MPERRRGWDRVIVVAAAIAVALLWIAAARARDAEAFALGVVLAAVVALLVLVRPRWLSALARTLLALLFVDITFWMAPAFASNTSAGEPLSDLLMPLALTATSVTGLLAIAATVAGRQATPRSVVAVVGIVALGAVAAGVAAAVAGRDRAVAKPGDLVVSTRNVEFSTDALKVASGRAAVVVTNHDLFWHTFTVDGLDLDVRVPTSGTRRAVFDARAGRYEFVCAIPGHESRMRGVLTVTD